MLETVRQRIRDTPIGEARPVVVFDLDSTLIHTGGRHLAIARAFAQDHGAISDAVDALTPSDFGWDVRDPLRARGVPEPILDALLAFWGERFFDGAWCAHDQPAPGAVPFVRTIEAEGAHVAYLTGRPEPTMGAGTRASLQQLGFPQGPRTSLHMKPTTTVSDARFKRVAVHEILAFGPIVATFENEPAHANAFLKAFPDAVHVLVGTVRDPRAPAPDPKLICAPDFLLVQP
jgi:hypothetical protein